MRKTQKKLKIQWVRNGAGQLVDPDNPLRKKPGRKGPAVVVPAKYAFPTISLRQVNILLVLIDEGMKKSRNQPLHPFSVDGVPVAPKEWLDLIRVFFRA